MVCSKAKELLSDYYDGQLSKEMHARVARHVEGCGRCRKEINAFESLASLAGRMAPPRAPDSGWDKLERTLDSESPSRCAPRRRTVPWRSRRALAIAATFLVAAVGLSAVFYASRMSEHHELAVNFDEFLREFARDPDAAQRVFIENYQARIAQPEEVAQLLTYTPVALRGTPDGYSRHAVYLMEMPCCRCSQVVFRRDDGGHIAVFEHDIEQSMWFGDRPCVCVPCNGKPCDVYQVDDSQLAVSFQLKKRSITIIGARDVEEISSLVAWLDKNSPDDPT